MIHPPKQDESHSSLQGNPPIQVFGGALYFISAAAQSGDTGTYIVYVTERPGVMGTAGDDLLEVGRGMDWAAGLGGNDTLSFENERGNPQVFVSLEEEFTDSPQNIRISGFENLTGKWGSSDWLRGTDGPNVLSGLGGDDRLIGNGGPDTLIGGPGLDWADYTTSPDAVGVSLLSGEGWRGDANGDQLDGIERLVGSIHDDTLTGDHGDNLLSGSAGNDLLMGHDGNDTLWGGPGEDTAVFDAVRSAYVVAFVPGQRGQQDYWVVTHQATNTADYLDRDMEWMRFADGTFAIGAADQVGTAGDDWIVHEAPASAVHGGAGTDMLSFAASTGPGMEAYMDLGLALARGQDSSTLILAFSGIENLTGTSRSDRLAGDDNGNWLRGLGGNDLFGGSAGADTLDGARGAIPWTISALTRGFRRRCCAVSAGRGMRRATCCAASRRCAARPRPTL